MNGQRWSLLLKRGLTDLIHDIKVVPQIGSRDSTQILGKYVNECLKKCKGVKWVHCIVSAAISFEDIETYNRRSRGT
jgi:hypothetical protein